MSDIIRQQEFKEIMTAHLLWQKTGGREGKQADFRGKTLEGVHIGSPNYPITLQGIPFDGATLDHVHTFNVSYSHCSFNKTKITGCKAENDPWIGTISCCTANDASIFASSLENLSVSDSEMHRLKVEKTYLPEFSMQHVAADDMDFNQVLVGSVRPTFDVSAQRFSMKDCYLTDWHVHGNDFTDGRMNHPVLGGHVIIEDCHMPGISIVDLVPDTQKLMENKAIFDIANSDMSNGTLKNNTFPRGSIRDTDVLNTVVVDNNFNRFTIDHTQLDEAMAAGNNYETTVFKDAEPSEYFVRGSVKLPPNGETFPFAYYPFANVVTCDKIYGISDERRRSLHDFIYDLKNTTIEPKRVSILKLKWEKYRQGDWKPYPGFADKIREGENKGVWKSRKAILLDLAKKLQHNRRAYCQRVDTTREHGGRDLGAI